MHNPIRSKWVDIIDSLGHCRTINMCVKLRLKFSPLIQDFERKMPVAKGTTVYNVLQLYCIAPIHHKKHRRYFSNMAVRHSQCHFVIVITLQTHFFSIAKIIWDFYHLNGNRYIGQCVPLYFANHPILQMMWIKSLSRHWHWAANIWSTNQMTCRFFCSASDPEHK